MCYFLLWLWLYFPSRTKKVKSNHDDENDDIHDHYERWEDHRAPPSSDPIDDDISSS